MEFETVERCGRTYVLENGVESAAFVTAVTPFFGTGYRVYRPGERSWHETINEALAMVAADMDTWYTATEAAAWLVEKGGFDKVTAHDICLWARNGLLPGAVKIPAPGQGGSWRIPASALAALAERRKER